jgi:microcystin-dependent protein
MAKLTLPNEIINETPADATPVEQNYTYIQQHVNNEQINRDGSVAMTAQLHLVGDPLNPTDAATKGYVDAILPVGIMMPFGGIVAPAGSWALCNGATLTTGLYPKLFAVLQYRFGGSGANFNLPDLAGRVIVGYNPGKPAFDTVGKAGGTYAAQLPLHSHSIGLSTGLVSADHGHIVSFQSGGRSADHAHTVHATGLTDMQGLHAHNSAYVDQALSGPGPYGIDRSMNALAGTGYLGLGTDTQGHHNHNVTVDGATGGESVDHSHSIYGGTQGMSANHYHTVSGGTANAGTDAVEHLPPYVTVSYVIRVG